MINKTVLFYFNKLSKVTIFNILNSIIVIGITFLLIEKLGFGRKLDIFFLANSTVLLVANLFLGSLLTEIFLPKLFKSESLEDEKLVITEAFHIIILFTTFAIIISNFIIFIFPKIFMPGLVINDIKNLKKIIFILTPLTLFVFLNSVFSTYLIFKKKIGIYEFSALIKNSIIIISVYFFNLNNIHLLALIYLSASVIQTIFLFAVSILNNMKIQFKINLKFFYRTDFFLLIIYNIINNLNGVIINIFLTILPSGSISIYNLAMNLFSKLNLFVNKGVVLLSHFYLSQKIKIDINKLTNNYLKIVKKLLLVSAFITIGITINTAYLLGIVKYFKNINLTDANLFIKFFSIIMISLIFESVIDIGRKFIIMVNRYNVMVFISIINLVVRSLVIMFFIKNLGLFVFAYSNILIVFLSFLIIQFVIGRKIRGQFMFISSLPIVVFSILFIFLVQTYGFILVGNIILFFVALIYIIINWEKIAITISGESTNE